MERMKVDPNWECFQSLSQRKYSGKYVVIALGRLVGAGKNLGKLLRLARKKHPRAMPFVARMRDPKKLCVYTGRLNGGTGRTPLRNGPHSSRLRVDPDRAHSSSIPVCVGSDR